MTNSLNESSIICKTSLWDTNDIWDTNYPQLTQCFQQTILVSITPLILTLLTPYDFRYFLCWRSYLNQNENHISIPWRWKNITCVFLTLICMIFSFSLLIKSVSSSVIQWSYFIEPAINFISFSWVLILQLVFRSYGRRISISLSIFWLANIIVCLIRTDQHSINYWAYKSYLFVSVIQLILSCFPDQVSVTRFRRLREVSEDITTHQNNNRDSYCPLENYNVFSRFTFFWVSKLTWNGFKRRLELCDLNRPCFYIQSRYLSRIFYCADDKINKSKKGNKRLFPLVWAVIYMPFLGALMIEIIYLPSAYFQPFILDKLLNFISSSEDEYEWHGYVYAILFCLSGMIAAACIVHADSLANINAIRSKSVLISAIYRKIFKLSANSRAEYSSGDIINLVSVDCKEIFEYLGTAHMLFAVPINLAIGIYFLYQYLGFASFGFVAMAIIVGPVSSLIGKKLDKLQEEQMSLKDKRMGQISELLNCIKVLKLYAWEFAFMNKINETRASEVKLLRRSSVLWSMIDVVWVMIPMLMASSCFTIYVLANYSQFNATTVFVSLSILNIMRFPISDIPNMITGMIRAIVSLKRIAKFLNAEEHDARMVTNSKNDLFSINVSNADFSWTSNANELALKYISFHVNKGSLVAVIGKVGEGKSSLLSALLGDLYKIDGTINVDGHIAYVPQTAWIQNKSLKENVLFLSEYEEERYSRVISSCALLPDIELLPDGDETEIGEKGVNLSGGQKQRVSLARAVYNNADVYLLDDPLSAVDAHVAQHLFQQVIGPNGLLKNKTRILVTHHLAFLSQVDVIFVMKKGKIIARGTYDELSRKNLSLLESKELFDDALNQPNHVSSNQPVQDNLKNNASQISRQISLDRNPSQISTNNKDLVPYLRQLSSRTRTRTTSTLSSYSDKKHLDAEVSAMNGRLIEDEFAETGSVKWNHYFKYIASCGIGLFIVFIIFRTALNVCEVGANYWLSIWTNELNNNSSNSRYMISNTRANMSESKRNFNLGIYWSLIISEGFFILLSNIIIYICALRVSITLHNKALLKIIRSPLSYFDCTPIGRILNRFSNDISGIDEDTPKMMAYYVEKITWLSIIYIIICTVSYILAIVIILIIAVFYFIYKLYLPSSNQFKRLETITSSPVQSHVMESIYGMSSIRAYNCVRQFIREANHRVDTNMNCNYHLGHLYIWLEFWCELLGLIITLSTACFVVYKRNEISPGLAGLILTYSAEAVLAINFLIRMTSQLEISMISVERIRELTKLPSEAEWETSAQSRPAKNWPTQGTVGYLNYSTTYRTGLEPVLKDITLCIPGGEKVGIVGRTGAGKSSLALSLFRIIEPTHGTIVIDGVDVCKLGLHDLREKITIIPQEATLFSGTLRFNLDPFEVHDDDELWSVLNDAHLGSFVSTLQDGLDFNIQESGDNLSAGQKQLICLARALLRDTRVIVLDEATAACDMETDRLIQKTIREKFMTCTVIAIAHRLHTVIDYDRILVLEDGRIAENGTPSELIQNKRSLFYQLAREAEIVFED